MSDEVWTEIRRRQEAVHSVGSLYLSGVGDLIAEGQRARDSEAELLEAAKPILRQYDLDEVWTGDMWDALRTAVEKVEGHQKFADTNSCQEDK